MPVEAMFFNFKIIKELSLDEILKDKLLPHLKRSKIPKNLQKAISKKCWSEG
jgi:hypothetical protein